VEDFSSAAHSAQGFIDLETGEIVGRYREGSPQSQASAQKHRGKIPKMPGSNSQNRVKFISLSPLGAHVMAVAKLTGRQYQVVFLLLRDMSYGGKCYTHPDHIASEIGMDSSDVRKVLKVLEEKNILARIILPNKGHCYWFNPRFITAKGSEETDSLYAIWAASTVKEKKARRAKQASPASGR